MEKYLKKIKPKYYWLIAFLLTALTYTMAFSYMGLLGNGTYVISRSDLQQQYIQFIEYFCSVIRGEHDYWFSWALSFGTGTALMFAYYTLSPFNLIFLFLGEDLALTATAIVIVLKAATAAATFQIFITKYLKKTYYETVLFAMMYGLCGFQVCYYFNIMWMDALYMLPVIALGFIKLFRERKCLFLLLAYSYTFAVNFYMGYIVGVSSFFLFLFAFFYNSKSRSLKENGKILFYYGISVVSAVLVTAAIWFPAAIQLFSNINEEYPSFAMSDCNLLLILNNLFMGQLQTLRGITPFVYSGLLSVILLPFFIVNKHIPKKKRIYVLLCFLLIICLFLIEPLNMMMHAFDNPGFYGQRFSYVFSFLLVTVCCEQMLYIRQINRKWIYVSMMICLGIYVASYVVYSRMWIKEYNANTWFTLGVNIVFFSLLIFVIRQIQNREWNIITTRVVLTFLVMIELGCNAALCISRMEHGPMKQDDYETWSIWEENTFDKIKSEDDAGFYRILSLNKRGQNQAFLYDYNAVENFNSAEHVGVMNALEKLGFYRGIHNLRGMGSTPVTRSLFNIKYEVCGYLIMGEGETDDLYLGYDQNEQVLALGYMVNEKIKDYKFEESPFANQDNLLSSMTGTDINCYERTGMELTVNSGKYIKTEDRTYLLHEEEKEDVTQFEFKADNDGRPLYIYLSQDRYLVITNGASLTWITTKDVSAMLENTVFTPELVPARIVQIGTDEEGEYSFTINLPENLEADYYKKAFFCYYDEAEFDRAYKILNEQQWEVTSYSDGYIEGTIEVLDDGIMFTSIPYDDGWRILVDGKETKAIPLLENAFLGIELGKGIHEVKMYYEAPGKMMGETVSCMTLISILTVCILTGIWRKKKRENLMNEGKSNVVILKEIRRKM